MRLLMGVKLFGGMSLLILLMSGCTSRVEREFMEGCVSPGVPKDVCSCTYDKIEERYSEEKLERMEKYRAIPEDFMEETINAMKICVEGE